jgi:hypothetical protein
MDITGDYIITDNDIIRAAKAITVAAVVKKARLFKVSVVTMRSKITMVMM